MTAPSGPPLDTAGIVSTVLEGILYGFSLLMFVLTIWLLLRGKSLRDVNRPMFAVASFLFLFSTAHIAIDINRIYEGLVKYRETATGGPIGYFEDVSQTSFVSKNAIYSFQTALGDGVVIYRAYKVWESIVPVILPILLWIAVSATSVGSVYTVSIVTPESTNIFASRTGQWITSFYSTTLACNITATLILAYRLWSIEFRLKEIRTSRSPLIPVLNIVIDAGALYSVTLLAALVCFVENSTAQYIVLDMVTPIISISFYMVILRVAYMADRRNAGTMSGRIQTLTGNGSNTVPRSQSIPLRPVQVHIKQLTEIEDGKNAEYALHQGDSATTTE